MGKNFLGFVRDNWPLLAVLVAASYAVFESFETTGLRAIAIALVVLALSLFWERF